MGIVCIQFLNFWTEILVLISQKKQQNKVRNLPSNLKICTPPSFSALNYFAACVRQHIWQNCGVDAWHVIFRVLKVLFIFLVSLNFTIFRTLRGLLCLLVYLAVNQPNWTRNNVSNKRRRTRPNHEKLIKWIVFPETIMKLGVDQLPAQIWQFNPSIQMNPRYR
jgi:hypothetical protein